jgi:hypothetical protein
VSKWSGHTLNFRQASSGRLAEHRHFIGGMGPLAFGPAIAFGKHVALKARVARPLG